MRARWLFLLAELPAVAGTAAIAWMFGRSVAARVRYPYDLEWMEGGLLVHAWRVMHGQGLYVEPGPAFIPYIYPPLYAWVVAALAQVFGLSMSLGRAVSVAGTLAAAAAAAVAVRGERVSWGFALAAAGLYLSCYEQSGTFYDLVRIDGLLMGLLSWALVAVRHGWLRTGGVLLFLAFATKHNAAIFGLPAVLWLWRTRGRAEALRFALWSAVPALALTVGLQVASGGLFLKYILGVPASHPIVGRRFFVAAPKEMLLALRWTTGLALLVALPAVRRWSPGGWYWAANGLVAALLCMLMRGHHGGFINVLMPAHWIVAVWGPLAADRLARRWPAWPLRLALGVLLGWQAWEGRWKVEKYLPTAEDYRAGEAVIARIRAIDGEVLSPYAPWYPVLAGKQPYFALIALWDIGHKRGPLKAGVDRVEQALAERRWAAVLTANGDDLGYGVKKHYFRAEQLPVRGRALFPKAGWSRRPTWIYLPRPPGEVGEDDGETPERPQATDPTATPG